MHQILFKKGRQTQNFYLSQPLSCKKGFTLIELAIIIVILGILIAVGAGLVGVLTKQAKLRDSRDAVKQAKEAVTGFAVKNGFLPADLNIPGAKGADAWGNLLSYYPSTELTSGNICAKNTTSMVVRECTNTACSTYNEKSNIAFILYSRGFDGDGACTGTSSPFYIREQDMGYNSPCLTQPLLQSSIMMTL